MKTGYPSIDRTHLRGIPDEMLNPKIYPLSMFATFNQVNNDHLDEPAIITNDRTYKKTDLKYDTIRVANFLVHSGLVAGDKIIILLPKSYEGIVTIFAANAIGVAVVMSDPRSYEEDLAAHSPKLVIDHDFLSRLRPINSPDIKRTMTEIEKHNLSKQDDPVLFLKTSGSTAGKPKTLPFSNRAIFAALTYAANSTGTTTRDETVKSVLCNAPYDHGYGWMSLFVNIMGGNPVILAGGAPEDIARYYKYSPSYIYGTPLMLKQFMELTPSTADLSFLSAFFCAGATIPEKEYQAGIAYFKAHGSSAEIRNNYGISEALCIGTSSDHVPHVENTIGKFYVGPKWLLVDEDLNEVKYGETGEVLVSADSLCQGYFNDPEATRAAFIKKDGETYFRTGDYLSLREDGYVTFVGRKRRFFFALGVTDKVNCETIEQAISSLDSVAETAVIITKDHHDVEGAKAFISFKDNVVPDDDFIKKTLSGLSDLLKSHELPREVAVIEKIPHLPSGKIDYHALETM